MFRNFLSPIDGFSNLPFRLLCQRYGAEAACVPLVNSTAIAHDPQKASQVDAHPDERNIGVQLVGNVPEDIGKSAAEVEARFPHVSWYNINCGCPSARTMRCGGGSAMLPFPGRIVRAVELVKEAVGKPVSVKIRVKDDLAGTLALCRYLEEAGAEFIVIHGRTAKQGYSGRADWELIRAVKEGISIPLVGNGDIASPAQGERYVREGYCDSYMVARAAMADPAFFSGPGSAAFGDKMRLVREYVAICSEYGEPQAWDVKLKSVSMMCGFKGAAAVRNRLCRARTVDEVLATPEPAASEEGV